MSGCPSLGHRCSSRLLTAKETIANIPLDTTYDANTIKELLEREDIIGLSPMFKHLTITLREPPSMPAKWKGYCSKPKGSGAMIFNQMGDATIVVCDGVLVYPLEAEIYNPPDWARDGQGKPKNGFGCDGLGHRDTEYMIFPGAFILHELVRLLHSPQRPHRF